MRSAVQIGPDPPISLITALFKFSFSELNDELKSLVLNDIEFGLSKHLSNIWGYSSAGRAPALHAGGLRFDPA